MLVSIITAAYNSEKTIARTLESVYCQTYEYLEYIVVDGGSTDSTMDIVKKYQKKFEEKGIAFHYLSEKDGGIYDAMNKGIRLATGKLIGMINSDDWYEPDAVACAVKHYEEQPYDLFYADLRIVSENGESFIKRAKNSRWITSRYWNHPTTFIPKALYEKYPYRNKTLHDDWELILRIRKAGAKVCVENKVLANFTRNGISHEKSWKKAFERARIKYQIYRENGYGRWYLVECYGMELAKMVV